MRYSDTTTTAIVPCSGFYYAEEGFYLPALFLSEGDALALFVTHHLGSVWRGTPFASAAEHAWEQLAILLPEEISLPPSVFGEYVLVVERSVPTKTEHWLTLLKAATSQRKVEIEYRAPGYGESVSRTLSPYRLVHHRGAWYVVAFDEFREEVRTYALSRVHAAQVLSTGFAVKNDFDPETYLDSQFGIYHEGERFRVRLRMDRYMADIVGEHVPDRGKSIEHLADGSVEIGFDTNQREELKHWVLQWGENVEVVEPKSLQDELLAVGQYFTQVYGNIT